MIALGRIDVEGGYRAEGGNQLGGGLVWPWPCGDRVLLTTVGTWTMSWCGQWGALVASVSPLRLLLSPGSGPRARGALKGTALSPEPAGRKSGGLPGGGLLAQPGRPCVSQPELERLSLLCWPKSAAA